MKKSLVAAWLAALILASGCATETKDLNEAERARLPGRFIHLSQGWVHYAWAGPENGPVVVLVHGFSTPSFVWEPVIPALADAGFRVLCFDLYGRGFSDRPDVHYNENLFDGQILELLDALSVKGPVDLVGLSMGGAIATIFCARHPEKVKKLVLEGPAGFPVNMPLASRLVVAPGLGDALMATLGDWIIARGADRAFYDKSKVEDFKKKFHQQLAYKGYGRSVLSTLRYFDLSDQRAAYEKVGRQKRPVLLLWGKEDALVPFKNNVLVRAAIPGAEFIAFDRAGHVPHYERPDEVNPLLVDFLKKS